MVSKRINITKKLDSLVILLSQQKFYDGILNLEVPLVLVDLDGDIVRSKYRDDLVFSIKK